MVAYKTVIPFAFTYHHFTISFFYLISAEISYFWKSITAITVSHCICESILKLVSFNHSLSIHYAHYVDFINVCWQCISNWSSYQFFSVKLNLVSKAWFGNGLSFHIYDIWLRVIFDDWTCWSEPEIELMHQ